MSESAPQDSPSSSRKSGVVVLEHLPTRLLYVEDDEDLRDMIAFALVDAGFDVTPVGSAESALEQLATSQFDIVLTDYNLTGETGAWLLKNAAEKGYLERTAAIVLTSEHRPAHVEGYRVLRKPADFGVILATISEAVGTLLPAGVVRVGAPQPTELELVLYVTSTSQESHKAIRNLHRALKPFSKNRYHLTIIDVASGGDEAWYQGLEEDRVIVTPTLVRKKPGPKTWIVGTLSPIESVERLLDAALGGGDDD